MELLTEEVSLVRVLGMCLVAIREDEQQGQQ